MGFFLLAANSRRRIRLTEEKKETEMEDCAMGVQHVCRCEKDQNERAAWPRLTGSFPKEREREREREQSTDNSSYKIVVKKKKTSWSSV